MRSPFVRVRDIAGEVKFCHVLRDVRTTVTTEELVIQRPHVSFRIPLANIVSLVPYTPDVPLTSPAPLPLPAAIPFAGSPYRITVAGLTVYTRSGKRDWTRADLVVPLSRVLLEQLARYSRLTVFR
ncbi:hypothetical protein [Calditerricola satsumensis]|uniref:Uncharacterized protein n=1 Tax=Calditerricola satsumensis TaxID=373054 RepID=A0A8J3B9F5_9BACI|nr:hypothetical protein [Calditerricola satsumensis]GGJ97549.1 hypothetical protein GCM10007043_09230 [Calditerricola satsumensis]